MVTVRASDGALNDRPDGESHRLQRRRTAGDHSWRLWPYLARLTSVNYAEDSTTAVGTYTARGENAASARWTLEGADRGDFTLSSTSGASVMLRFRTSPDFENPKGGRQHTTPTPTW